MKKENKSYATVVIDEGDNYREIADIMTDIGFTMNHSSARNYVLKVMKKFVKAFSEKWGMEFSEKQIDEIAKSPLFQQGIAELLHIEMHEASKSKTSMTNNYNHKP